MTWNFLKEKDWLFRTFAASRTITSLACRTQRLYFPPCLRKGAEPVLLFRGAPGLSNGTGSGAHRQLRGKGREADELIHCGRAAHSDPKRLRQAQPCSVDPDRVALHDHCVQNKASLGPEDSPPPRHLMQHLIICLLNNEAPAAGSSWALHASQAGRPIPGSPPNRLERGGPPKGGIICSPFPASSSAPHAHSSTSKPCTPSHPLGRAQVSRKQIQGGDSL